ncbi:hypothetical protein DVK44_24090 [Streptomyces paludis]|uniref:Uncharacterized protein n=1 Tax=Streptomyces paludis TaxID=2282738 RepID=A0A345I1P0_9ACTN|nr:hypothetical protein DVK44_24090 [Streptomyces paludis]
MRAGLVGPVLYARSRALTAALATLIGTALVAAWAAHWLQEQPRFDHTARIVVVTLAPLFAASTIGAGLYTWSDELDRTAVRRWWPLRTAQPAVLTAFAAVLLALAVPGHPEAYGAPAMVRNLLGTTGLALAAAALLGARLSWLPVLVYTGAAFLSAPSQPSYPSHSPQESGSAATVAAWLVEPGPSALAWVVAAALYAGGAALHSGRGARRAERL